MSIPLSPIAQFPSVSAVFAFPSVFWGQPVIFPLGFVLVPSLFNTCMDWVLDRAVGQSHCEVSVGNTEVTDLVFADDAVIFAEAQEVLVMSQWL